MGPSIANRPRLLTLATCIALSGCAHQRGPIEGGFTSQPMEMPSAAAAREASSQPPQSNEYTGMAVMSEADAPDESLPKVPTLIEGSGRFVGGTRGAPLLAIPQADGLILNFVDADIREVVQLVLGDALGVSYLLDPRVTGNVTLRSTDQIGGDALVDVLETALRASQAALILDDDVYKVVPIADAPRTALRSQISFPGGSIPPGYALTVMPLRYVSAQQMLELIQPIAGTEALVRADTSRNLIMIAAPSQQVQSVADALSVFDVDWLSGLSLAVYPLDNTSAQTVVAEVQAILDAQAGQTLSGVVSLLPVERLNAVLVATKQKRYLDRISAWIDQLDSASADGANLYVYRVQNGLARDLAQLLNDLFQGSSGSTTAGRVAPGLQPTRVTRDGPGATNSATNVSSPRTALSGAGFGEELDVRVIADETNNALLIMANARDYRRIEGALRKLDIVPLQLLIEATIAEVTLNDRLEYGVQFLFQDRGIADTAVPQTQSLVLTGGTGQAIAPNLPGFSAMFRQADGDAQAVLSALDTLTDVNVVSSPQLLVRDNQTAELQVGDEVPVVTQQQQGTVAGSSLVNTVEFKNTGVILNVTPRITSGGLITLEIEQEVSQVANNVDTGLLTPTISTRRISSSISVYDGDMVVLGGLISESRNLTSRGLPGLSRVPVMGALFSQKERQKVRTELIVLISPTILRSRDDMRAVTDELLSRVDSLRDMIE